MLIEEALPHLRKGGEIKCPRGVNFKLEDGYLESTNKELVENFLGINYIINFNVNFNIEWEIVPLERKKIKKYQVLYYYKDTSECTFVVSALYYKNKEDWYDGTLTTGTKFHSLILESEKEFYEDEEEV